MTMKRLKSDLSPEITTCLKLKDTVRPDCCRVRDPIPYDAECFMKDISKELKKLYERHERMFVRRKRIMELALPLRRYCRFVPKCCCPFQRTIEMVPAEPAMYTRTEQLAIPLVRRLLVRRSHAITKGDKIGELVLNRWLRSSYLSMYSRLANIQPLQKPKKKRVPSKKQKLRHAKHIDKLAKPRPIPKPAKPERQAGEINMRRLKKLARPKRVDEAVKPPWECTDNIRKYKASDRVKTLAEPKVRENVHINDQPEKVSPNALQYKPSPRIKELSEPLVTHGANSALADVKEDPFGISPNALKYKPSSRIKELAEPREFENTHIRDNPFAISPAALKAKASPRLVELAKPKGG